MGKEKKSLLSAEKVIKSGLTIAMDLKEFFIYFSCDLNQMYPTVYFSLSCLEWTLEPN